MRKQQVSEEWRIKPGIDKEIIFENGWKGIFSVAGKDTQKLSLWDLEIAGRKFTCAKQTRQEFEKFLATITDTEVDVMFIYSSEIKLPPSWRDRRKKKIAEPLIEEKTKSIDYNCTVRVPKQCVQPMFDNVAVRTEQFVRLLADMIKDQYIRDQQNKGCEI